MNRELSEETFEKRLVTLPGGITAYVRHQPSAAVDLILLHEHLGLQNYLRVMAQALTNGQCSIVLPNLFPDVEEEEEEEDNQAYLQQLSHSRMASTLLSVIDHVASRGKKVVLVGFSLGAAIGLKILELTAKVDMAFLFYGLPPLETVHPQLVEAAVTVFLGEEDSVKHLSDRALARKARKVYNQNSRISFVELEGARHGFMNPASESYNEALFKLCSRHVQDKLALLSLARQPVGPSQHRR
jgi:dienelactone hydrolase